MGIRVFLGIVAGVVLTILGGLMQHYLHLEKEKQRRLYDQTALLAEDMNKRHYLGSNVIFNSTTDMFPDRWELYICEGVTPWNIKRNQYIEFMEANFSTLKTDFEVIDSCFMTLHPVLNRIRRYRQPEGNKSGKHQSELSQTEQEALTQSRALQDKINSFQKQLFRQVQN